MGGDVNREFMAVAAVGEDDFVWCKAATTPPTSRRRGAAAAEPTAAAAGPTCRPMEEVHTPDLPGIAGVVEVPRRRARRRC